MVFISTRLPENVDGPFFVDSDCTDCDTCRCIAPDFFDRSEKGYSYVARQPVGEDEEEEVLEAMDCCPADAIRREE